MSKEDVYKSVRIPLNQKTIDALVERELSFLEGLVDDTKKNTISIITDALTKGESPDIVKKRLMEQGFDSTRAESIARTEMMYALNEGAKAEYKSSDINFVEWSITEDEITCTDTTLFLPDGSEVDGCAGMSGKIFNVDNTPDMPGHPRCRCSWLPSEGPENW